jgi:peptidoglycan/LPS O-acetylase OafA/YrhL
MFKGSRALAPRAGGRYSHLDGLRGCAALVVMLHHCINTFDLAITTGHARHAYGRLDALISGLPFLLVNAGNFSVCIFFTLSGFVLALAFSHSRLGAPALVAKRYVRLAVPILVSCLASYALLSSNAYRNTAVAAHTRSDWAAAQFLQTPQILAALREGTYRDLLTSVPGSLSYNSTLWTMQVEFAGSLFLIAIICSLRYWLHDADAVRGYGLLLFVITALAFSSTYLLPFSIGAAMYFGGAGRDVSAEPITVPRWRTACYVALGACALFFGTIPYSSQPTLAIEPFTQLPALPHAVPLPLVDAQAFWHVIGAAGVLFIVQTSAFWREMLEHRWCRFLGDISFPLYLIHVPVLCSAGAATYLFAIAHGCAATVAVFAAVFVTIVVSLTLAFLATFLVERPSIVLSDYAARTVQTMIAACTARPCAITVANPPDTAGTRPFRPPR